MAKNVTRRSFLTMVAAAPIVALAACSSDDATGTDATSTDATNTDAATDTSATEAAPTDATNAGGTETTTATASTETPATSAAKVTGTLNFLNFTAWAGPNTYADFAKAFPGATVNEIAWASADDTVSKAKDRAGDIDLVLVDGTTYPRLSALGVLAKLGDVPNMSLIADQYKNTA
jgi:ABC-type uncharacterized transport system YnjBCD substrate-binding protein